MDRPMRAISFKVMSFIFIRIRDRFLPPEGVVQEAGLKPGSNVLDYGCGPGSYTLAAAHIIGEAGTVYALDIHPLALRRVHEAAARQDLKNIRTIHSDCATGLPDGSIDAALLYDIYHMLGDPGSILTEIDRVMKPDALLSLSDHHMRDEAIVAGVTGTGLFQLAKRDKRTFTFYKASESVLRKEVLP